MRTKSVSVLWSSHDILVRGKSLARGHSSSPLEHFTSLTLPFPNSKTWPIMDVSCQLSKQTRYDTRSSAKRSYSLDSSTENKNKRARDSECALESEEESVYHGYDTETNDYTLEQLSKRITKTQQSKELRNLIRKLKEEVKQKCPKGLRKS